MSHADLVERGKKWLINSRKCWIACIEMMTYAMAGASECPDVFGVKGSRTYIIECIRSRDDFIKDQKKIFRYEAVMGMGRWRYYLCPPGLIQPEEIPEMWGLLWCYPTMLKIIKKPQDFGDIRNYNSEISMLSSVAARARNGCDLEKIESTFRKLKEVK